MTNRDLADKHETLSHQALPLETPPRPHNQAQAVEHNMWATWYALRSQTLRRPPAVLTRIIRWLRQRMSLTR